jgi:hypothetical protein
LLLVCNTQEVGVLCFHRFPNETKVCFICSRKNINKFSSWEFCCESCTLVCHGSTSVVSHQN